MDQQALLDLGQTAYRFAVRKLPDKEAAKDFASWCTIRALEAGKTEVRIDWVYADYLRESLGRNGSARSHGNLNTRATGPEIERQHDDSTGTAYGAVILQKPKNLTALEARAFDALVTEAKTQASFATECGFTPSRANMLWKQIEAKVAKELGLQRRREARSRKVFPGVKPLREIEREYIFQILSDFGGNRTHAADALGISLRGLRNKIREFNIDVPAPVSWTMTRRRIEHAPTP